MKKEKKLYIRTILVAILLTSILSLYNIVVNRFDENTFWALADALFGAALILIMYGLLVYLINKGGFASFRYWYQKKKDKKNNQITPPYAEFLTRDQKRPTGHIFIISTVMILLSFVFSYI